MEEAGAVGATEEAGAAGQLLRMAEGGAGVAHPIHARAQALHQVPLGPAAAAVVLVVGLVAREQGGRLRQARARAPPICPTLLHPLRPQQ